MTSDFIPMMDLAAEQDVYGDEITAAIKKVLESGTFINGPKVQEFESKVAEYLDVRFAVGLNSGTDALMIGLEAMGVGPGDEVITTPFSFVATAEVIRRVGARPVFADISVDSYLIDPQSVEQLITPRTKVIVPVHLFGEIADMDSLCEIAHENGIAILEDAAQAFGASQSGRKAGTFGVAGAFSFFPSKPLGAYGDGGLLATDDERLALRVRQLARHGAAMKYHSELVGVNSRLDEIQAAILGVKLKRVDKWNARRREVAALYTQKLSGISELLHVPSEFSASHVYHQYTIRLPAKLRDLVKDRLSQQNIASMVYYPFLINEMPAYAESPNPARYHQAKYATQTVLSLPISPFISESQISRVCDTVSSCF